MYIYLNIYIYIYIYNQLYVYIYIYVYASVWYSRKWWNFLWVFWHRYMCMRDVSVNVIGSEVLYNYRGCAGVSLSMSVVVWGNSTNMRASYHLASQNQKNLWKGIPYAAYLSRLSIRVFSVSSVLIGVQQDGHTYCWWKKSGQPPVIYKTLKNIKQMG